MKIGICGNEASIKKGIIMCEEPRLSGYTLVSYTPENLLLDVEEGFFDCTILFMDIGLEEFGEGTDTRNISSFELVDKVNKRFPQCQVVYISDGKGFDERVYETKHTYLMTRDSIQDKLAKALTLSLDNMKYIMDKDVIEIVSEGRKNFIHRDQIIYIERDNRRLLVVTPNKLYPCYDSIANIMDKLDNRMVRVHGGGIVHLGYISYFGKGEVEISYEGIEKVIPVGRTYRKTVREAYQNYWKKHSD